eukprot:9336034-Pyramimonas_sp.AAC.1
MRHASPAWAACAGARAASSIRAARTAARYTSGGRMAMSRGFVPRPPVPTATATHASLLRDVNATTSEIDVM